MPTSPNPLLWSFYRQIGAGEETGGMVHHEDAHSSDLYLNSGVREQNANVQFGDWENASWGQVQEFYPEHYSNFELDQPYAGNVYATGVKLNDPVNELYLHHYRYDRENTQLEEISKSQVSYKPVVPRPVKDDRLRFVAMENGSTITIVNGGSINVRSNPKFEYSLDGGTTWSAEYLYDEFPVLTLNYGDVVYFRGENDYLGYYYSSRYGYCNFRMTGLWESYGSIDYLIHKDGHSGNLINYCYYGLFNGCESLLTPPDLPSTFSLYSYCYARLFYDCTRLRYAPELDKGVFFPHTAQGAGSQYAYMFYGCSSLTEAPVLNRTELSPGCYTSMFQNCTGLVNAPELPATTLPQYCYDSMFWGCTGLERAPTSLPAVSLSSNCYRMMFTGCTSLRETPEIFAVDTAYSDCMSHMFSGCSLLQKAVVHFSEWKTTSSYSENARVTYRWMYGVPNSGIFICPDGLTRTYDESHIPSGWVVRQEKEDNEWPTIPYLTLTNGDVISPLAFSYSISSGTFYLNIRVWQGTPLYTSDALSPTGSYSYTFESGASIYVDETNGKATVFDKDGQELFLYWNFTPGLFVFPSFAYYNDQLVFFLYTIEKEYLTIDTLPSDGHPGYAHVNTQVSYTWTTEQMDYYAPYLHAHALAITGGADS